MHAKAVGGLTRTGRANHQLCERHRSPTLPLSLSHLHWPRACKTLVWTLLFARKCGLEALQAQFKHSRRFSDIRSFSILLPTPFGERTTTMATKMVLYSYWRSTSTWRVRIALQLKNIPFEYRAINLLKGEQSSGTTPTTTPVLRAFRAHR